MNDHDVAACGHSNRWTYGSGKCLACECDALRLRVAKLEAEKRDRCAPEYRAEYPIWPSVDYKNQMPRLYFRVNEGTAIMNDHNVATCGHSNHWTYGPGKLSARTQLWQHMHNVHGVTLTESQQDDIEHFIACECDALRLRVAELEAEKTRQAKRMAPALRWFW